ncbi:hypothetical protein JTE90_021302 [Oedothorax gibbosus]|uniref:Uncharacterized protein n=1 Tax=Oedothorax gibbosus TaxID=931172 RepID=A0AAV6VLJ7_9ARAC|nr:hypothetical protein JTE90_021302 [Oedothorax gibbosus]
MDNNCGNQCKHSYRRGSNKDRFSSGENCCFRGTREQSRLTNPFECTSRCCAEDFTKTSDEKNVCFTNEVQVINDCSECSVQNDLQAPGPKHSDGICLCCREGKGPEPSKKVVKSVLVYDFPEPKFDDLTISKRDFVPKPLPNRGLPPWHPACKDRWHPLDAASVKKTIYKRDYTPPIILPSKRSTESTDQYRYLIEEDFDNEKGSHKQHDQTVQYPVWRKTTTGPCETIEVCTKPRLPIFGTQVHESPKENNSYHAEEMEHNPEQLQLHGPDCEKHCYSTPLRCHDRRDSKERIQLSSSRVELAAMTIEKNHFTHEEKKVGFASEVCHVEPISESKFNCMKEATEKNSECGGECGDCKDAYCCKRMNSCIQPEGYFTSKDRFQNSFPAHKTESYNNERVDKTLNSGDECYEERSIPSSECEYQTDNNYPKNPEESSAPHYTDSKQFHFKCECDHGCNDSHPRRETSRMVSFEEDSKCSSNYSRSKMNDNSNVDTEFRRDPSPPNEFTVCEGKSLSHVKWWKLGGCANGDRSNDCNDTPNERMKFSRPVST